MSNKSDGNKNQQSAKVVKLGLNISVSGDPGTDFEIVLDDKEQKAFQSSSSREEHLDVLALESSPTDTPKHELEKTKTQEVKHSTGAIRKHSTPLNVTLSSDSGKMSESESGENSSPQEESILNKIKSTMEHFEKFSDHIKEIPRLRNRPLATSTPFSEKYNSKSESCLVPAEIRPRKFSHLYDFQSRKDYFKSSVKPSPPDLFLKPLPAENYYKRGIYTRFFDFEPYRHYGSDISLNKTECKNLYGKYDVEKYEGCSFLPDPPSGILKKSDSESGDKQSTSSADSVKDIKIYQSGGILIMQNFKENMDATEKKEISEFSAKLIENCNKLKMEVGSWPEEKTGNVSDDNRNSGKMVQFDLSSFEGPKSKSGDSSVNLTKEDSSGRMESSESTSDCMKNKDTSPQGTSQSQDLTSLSTQENDSFMSNPPGMSPTYASSKKLEWDSGADVGYLNLDLTKENLSTIEKIVLKGLSSDGLSEENIVYEKKSKPNPKNRSKFTMERFTVAEEIGGESPKTNDSTREKTAETTTEGESLGESERKKKGMKTPPVENCKGDIGTKFEAETKPSSNRTPTKELTRADDDDIQKEKKSLELSDKSVNVNTLFENEEWKTPPHRIISRESARLLESNTKLTHRRPSHSPKTKVSKNKSRPSSQRSLKASKKPTHITGPFVTSYFDMGNPKKVYKKVEANPVLNEAELSREVEEIIIDQRFKIKNVGASGRESAKEPEVNVKDKVDSSKETKSKSRPISASSSSNNTVLPKSDNGEEKTKNVSARDQMIQTSDYDCESVGVQAFASQVSSDCDFKSLLKKDPPKDKKKPDRENVNTCSKNIQAFGLNCSLPKQLEHPTGTEMMDNQNTKSTQFFGGPLNSLPNYHSSLCTKVAETCGRTPNVLKTKRNSEIIRVKEENEKNILANDPLKPGELKEEARKVSNIENKENLITKNSSNSKRSQSNASGKYSGDSEKKESERNSSKGKKKSASVEGSDDVSSLVLTSEALKVHGDSIDRNIIQEKYFQSQLVELEKREMISRSTSMEMQLQIEGGAEGKEYATTGCQYSPQSRRTISGGLEAEDDSYRENTHKNHRKEESPEQYGLSESECPNTGEERFGKSTNPDQNIETGDSLPSSTQTAHSWVAGMRNSRENSNGVGKARSFEYLPGHIYESSGNLREELPSETEQNLITSCSSDSDTARGTVSNDGGRDSEGRNTLILENSTENSHDTDDRLKILDETLTQLNSAVMKLWEKDAQVKSVTQSLLANLCTKRGSGDWLPLAGGDTPKTEAEDNKDVPKETKKRTVGKLSEISAEALKDEKEKEFSIACQTEEKSLSSNPEKYYEEKKALEKRINQEKKCQIQWIENEIHHLNVLRELLEKQSSPAEKKKKKRSVLSVTSNESSKSEESYQKNVSTGIYPRPVTPVYGCTISLSENVPPECNRPALEQPRDRECYPSQYGLAVSLSGSARNWRRVVMLPVGVQVSLKDTNSSDDCNENTSKENTMLVHRRSSLSSEKSLKAREPRQSNAHTQCPSSRRPSNVVSSSMQTDLPSPVRSGHCNKENCFCLNLSDKSCSTSRSKTFERPGSSKLYYINEECGTENGNKTSHSTDPDFLETENDPVSQPEKIVRKNPSDLSESFSKSKSAQSTNCKCQNCPKRVSSAVVKQGMNHKGLYQPNTYVNSEKFPTNTYKTPTDELGIFNCSKVQVQKTSNCAIHALKMHGSKCHLPETNYCSCRRGSVAKKTENQSCQTDSEPIVTKELIKYPEISTVAEGPQVKNTYEMKIALERKKALVEKLPCETKVSYERVHPTALEQNGLNKKEVVPVKVKTAMLNCTCSRKADKEKAKTDDHPRHYFLRIEEAEIDDSNETPEPKKSLEVVTVTVPVKRAGRGKIYCSNIRQGRDAFEDNFSVQEVSSKSCNICEECAKNRRKTSQDYDTREGSGCRRTRAEKPESPGRPVISPECNYYGGVTFYDGENQPTEKEYDHREYYPDRNIPQQRESSHSGRFVNGNHELRCCENCNCLQRNTPPSRETLKDYDSHKKRRGGNVKECCSGGNENRRKWEEGNNKTAYDVGSSLECSSESRHSRRCGFNAEPDGYSPEFYNYNKREFMTKSELKKEEEQKRKIHQPSLQECLSSNRPDFYSSAERRRQIIAERAKERVQRHNSRMDCLMKMLQHCNQKEQTSGPKRIFTTVEMREQTLKRYRKLPEVTGKIADEKKREEYRTNRLMADIFGKKLQIEALKASVRKTSWK